MNTTTAARQPTIRIRNLRLSGIVGILPHERTTPQPIVINAEFTCSNLAAAETDEIRDAIDYAILCEDFGSIVETTQHHLLETLAKDVLDRVMADERVTSAKISVAKPDAIEDAETVEIELTCQRET